MSGQSTSPSSTLNVVKSSWSCSPASSRWEGRESRSSSAAASRPRSTTGSTAPSRATTRLTAGRSIDRDLVADPAHLRLAHEVRLVEDDEVRAGELLLEELLERALVVEGVVRLALGLDRGRVRREEPRRVGGGVDHRHHPVHGHPGADGRPAERLDEGLREREPRGLDDDVVGGDGAVEEGLDGGQEVIRHGAADAAVGKLEDIVLLAALDPAALDDFGVDPDVPELVDDEREAPSVRALARRWRTRLVLPAPRKPVMTVAGIRVVMGSRPSLSIGGTFRSRVPAVAPSRPGPLPSGTLAVRDP